MKCKRCRGLCVLEDVEENGRSVSVERCINCGNVSFPTGLGIKINRKTSKKNKKTSRLYPKSINLKKSA